MVEGARLESVFRGNSNVGSNPTLSAIVKLITQLAVDQRRSAGRRVMDRTELANSRELLREIAR